MLHIAWPWMALSLPLPWLLYRLRSQALPQGIAVFVPTVTQLDDARAFGAVSWLRVPWQRWALAGLWVLLVAAAMRPQWLGAPEPIASTGRRLELAVDVSGSMATGDMADNASRLRVVQQVAGQFIDGRRGDRIGLLLFGTRPYLQAPLTSDLATVHRFLDEAVIGVAGRETAIGDAIGLAIKQLRTQPATAQAEKPTETVLVLLTDGQNDAGVMPPLQAARLARQAGLRIYTIGVGAAADESPFGFATGNNDLDETTLRAIAQETGGRYFRATDANALHEVYRQIDRLEPAAGREQWVRPTTEWFSWPLGVALLLSVPLFGLGVRQWD
jgi:Ca-activated chloride channel family protein